jgi:hypothetical protein
MFLSTHALAGIIISQHVNYLPLAFGLGVFSHYFLDVIPHGDENLGAWVKEKPVRRFLMNFTIDMLFLSLFVSTIRWKQEWPNPNIALAGIIGAVLPDVISTFYEIYRLYLLKWFPNATKTIQNVIRLESFFEHHQRLHQWFHHTIERRIRMRTGLLLQAILAGALLFASIHP